MIEDCYVMLSSWRRLKWQSNGHQLQILQIWACLWMKTKMKIQMQMRWQMVMVIGNPLLVERGARTDSMCMSLINENRIQKKIEEDVYRSYIGASSVQLMIVTSYVIDVIYVILCRVRGVDHRCYLCHPMSYAIDVIYVILCRVRGVDHRCYLCHPMSYAIDVIYVILCRV